MRVILQIFVFLGSVAFCEQKVEIKLSNCFATIEQAERTKIHVNLIFSSTAKLTSKDPEIKYSFEWKMERLDNKEKIPVTTPPNIPNKMTIKPLTLTTGMYRFDLRVVEKDGQGKIVENTDFTCFVRFFSSVPKSLISGGSSRVVPSFQDILIDGSQSLDVSPKTVNTTALRFNWTCTQQSADQNYCKNGTRVLSTDSRLTIPSKFAVGGEIFTINVKVFTWDGVSSQTSQIVKVLDNAIVLSVVCNKNCPPSSPSTIVKSATLLYASCLSNCGNLQDDDYEWTVKDNPEFDFDKDTDFGKRGRKFAAKSGVLSPGNHDIEVNLKPPLVGSVVYTLRVEAKIVGKRCKILPQSGLSLRTEFRLKCGYSPDLGYRLELYGGDYAEDGLVFVGSIADAETETFVLPKGSNFDVKISKLTGSYLVESLKANVKSSIDKDDPDSIKNNINDVYNGTNSSESLLDLMRGNNTEKALQRLESLVEDLVDVSSDDGEVSDTIKKLKRSVIKDLLGTSIDSKEEISQSLRSVGTLMGLQDNKTDTALARFATVFCKKLAEKHLAMIQADPYPTTLSDSVLSVTKSLSDCTSANTNPNEDVLKPESLEDSDYYIYTTPGPPINMDGSIVEDYENYENFDEDYYKNQENLAESTSNIFRTSAVAAKSVAMTTAVGEKFVEHEGRNGSHKILVAKDLGVSLVKSTLQALGVRLKLSKDLNVEHPFDILISVWNKDLMWWNPGKVRIMTDLLNVEIWHSTCKDRVLKFDDPVNIYMDVKEKFANHYFQPIHEVYPVPMTSRSKLSKRAKEIRTRRINLLKNQGVLINFANISGPSLDVVIVKMRQPMIEDFARKTRVDEETTLFYLNKADYDVWIYVAVLPSPSSAKTTNATEISYDLTVVTPSCIAWIASNSTWNTSNCSPGGGSTLARIHCRCRDMKLSTLSGLVESLDSVLQEAIELDFYVEISPTFVVFVWVSLATFVFVCLLIYLLRKRFEEIYFLADNRKSDRYAYLIIVRTDNAHNAGTTSNISIKLFGTNDHSKAHVLNYPDPHRRLLQTDCEDWFVLACRSHLGELRKVVLWTDAIGANSSWICRYVSVYDMQKKREWLFKVGAKLSVSNEMSRIVVTPDSDYLNRDTFWRRLRVWNENHTWFLGRCRDNLLYIERISIIYSSLLFNGAFSLVLFGLPSLSLADSFDRSLFFEADLEVYLVILGTCTVSSCVHIGLAWTFRESQPQITKYPIETRFSYRITLICWGILLLLILSSATILLVFGWWLPIHFASIWLASCVISVFLQIVVYENLLAVVRNFVFRREWKHHIGEKFACIVECIEKQRTVLYETFGSLLLRPYFKHLYAPLAPDEVKVKKLQEAGRKIVVEQVQDLIMFGVYILILYLVILMGKDEFTVNSNKEMVDLLEGKHSRTDDFNDLESLSDMFFYIYRTLIPSMQSGVWYGTYYSIDAGLMKDFSNKYLGVARIRQLRLRPDKYYEVPKSLRFTDDVVQPEITLWTTDKKTYSRGWTNRSLLMQRDRLANMWRFSKPSETGSPITIGVVSTYSGGGYVMPLGRTMYNSNANLRMSSKYGWIDNRTRCTIIEFLAYNANYNMFNSVKLLVEHSASGYTHTTMTINTARMLYVQNETENLAFATFALFVFWVGFLLLRKSIGLLKNFRTAYKDVWFFIDMVILLMSLTCISLVILRIRMLGNFMSVLERSKHNKFVNYFNLFYVESVLSVFSAFLVCVATVRLWRFLRFILAFRIMERTLVLSAVPLLHILLCHFVFLMCFAFSGIFLFGNKSLEFMDIENTLTTIMQLSLNLYKSFDFEGFSRLDLSGTYFILTSVAMYILNFLYITNIVLAYARAQIEFSSEVETYTVKDYAKEKVKYFPIWCKVKVDRLKGGGENDGENTLVTPKDVQFRYAQSIQTTKYNMTFMEYLLEALIYNGNKQQTKNILKPKDEEMMLKISKLVINREKLQEEKEFFFIENRKNHGIVLVDERRIIKIEKATNLLLQSKTEIPDPDVLEKEVSKSEQCSQLIKRNLTTLKRCELRLKLISIKLDEAIANV